MSTDCSESLLSRVKRPDDERMRKPIPEPLASRPFPISRASTLGVSRKMLRGRGFQRLQRGVYATADRAPAVGELVGAALLVLPSDAVAISVTGLMLYGVDVADLLPMRFASRHPHHVRRSGIVVSRVADLPSQRRGQPFLATPEHCFVTAAQSLNVLELVIAGDWLIRLGLTSPARLVTTAEETRVRGSRLARRAAGLVRRRVDSPRESRLRICLVLAGLPTPQCNLTLGTNDYPIGTVDLVYEEFKVILEYEGDQHRVDRQQWNIDIDRTEEFTAEGYLVIRITAQRMKRPRHVVGKVFNALRQRGYPGPEPVFTTEWCLLFESSAQ